MVALGFGRTFSVLALAMVAWQGCLDTGPTDLEGQSYTTPALPKKVPVDGGAATTPYATTTNEPVEDLCPAGRTQCGQQCVDTSVSLQHCGACGSACSAGQVCTPGAGGSECAVNCGGGTVRCGASCSRLDSDPANCGACGMACATGQACVNNACVGATCTPNAQELCYTGPAETLGVGSCKAGRKTCNSTGTGFSACSGEKLPTPETCGDNVDNNCNMQVDEGCSYSLVVTKNAGTGTGVVTSSVGGINCGTTCAASIAANTLVTLTAQPSPNHTFAWTGSCTGSGACIVTMSQARSVGVTFTAPPACGGAKKTFTYSPTVSFYNQTFSPACTATTLVATASNLCAPSLVDLKFNGNVGYTFLQQNVVNGTLTSYYSIQWPAGVAPVTTVNMTLGNVYNKTCSVSIALN